MSNKKGPQHIPIVSPALMKILNDHLKKHPDQKYLLMRNGKALNNVQILEIIYKEIGSKETHLGYR